MELAHSIISVRSADLQQPPCRLHIQETLISILRLFRARRFCSSKTLEMLVLSGSRLGSSGSDNGLWTTETVGRFEAQVLGQLQEASNSGL